MVGECATMARRNGYARAERSSAPLPRRRSAVLAFGVDDYDLTEGWNVTVIGPSRLISDPSHVTALDALGVVPWAPVTTHCYIALRMAVVRGQRISAPRGALVRSPHGRTSPPAPTRPRCPAEVGCRFGGDVVGPALGTPAVSRSGRRRARGPGGASPGRGGDVRQPGREPGL